MAEPSQPVVLSDEEEDQNAISSTLPFQPLRSSKKRRTEIALYPNRNPPTTVLVLDDDDDDDYPQVPLPRNPPGATSPLYFVLDDSPSTNFPSGSRTRVSDSQHKCSGLNRLVCLESDNESESSSGKGKMMENESNASCFRVVKDFDWSSIFDEPTCSPGHDNLANMSEEGVPSPISLQDDSDQVLDYLPRKENRMDQVDNAIEQRRKNKVRAETSITAEAMGRKKPTKEERVRLLDEKNLKKEQEKLQKAALKAEAADRKKIQKEKQKWVKGKLAQKSIVAEIDAKILEQGSVGGNLLTRFAERGLTYRITPNPIERSIVWTMTVPEHISQSSEKIEIQYVLLVYEAEDFCNLVMNESLWNHVSSVRTRYPSYTVCYLTHKLMPYINNREQEVYKNPTNDNGWRRPPVEEVLAKLTTNFLRVHSRQCIDEAELADHIVGLTSSLSSCQFRKKLTRLDVNANGHLKDCVDRNIINKIPWLKALVAIPKVQPRCAIAIWKKYPTMKSLLSVYMDPYISVHQKEFLLEDLVTEGLLGDDRRVGEVCSKRVYRILMAQSGSMKTDDVEDGADLFGHQLT